VRLLRSFYRWLLPTLFLKERVYRILSVAYHPRRGHRPPGPPWSGAGGVFPGGADYAYNGTQPHAVQGEGFYAYDPNGNPSTSSGRRMTCRIEDGVTYKQYYNAENRISGIAELDGNCLSRRTPGAIAPPSSNRGAMPEFTLSLPKRWRRDPRHHAV
jgi:hypothetical protein